VARGGWMRRGRARRAAQVEVARIRVWMNAG